MEIFVVTISSHIISFCFLPIFAQLRKTKIGRFKAEELAVTGKNNEQQHLQLHFIIIEVTEDIMIFSLST